MENKNIPIKHHYIPQFILRNFLNGHNKLYYYDKNIGEVNENYTSNIFMELNLNKDEINHAENPMWIEEELSYFESDIAPLFKKLNNNDEIILRQEDIFKLRIFLLIMMFRSKHVRNEFIELHDNVIDIYKLFQDFDNSEDLWKKNLSILAQCRNQNDMMKLQEINPIILEKLLKQLSQYYTTIIEKRGNADFIISDMYPTLYNREIKGRVFPVCLFCPISPNRMLVLNYMNNDSIFKNDKVITRNLSYPPQPYDYRIKSLKLVVKKVYQNEVEEINEIIYNNAKEGVIINSNDIQKSIKLKKY